MQPKDLFSAYIDGELYGEELALAERTLAEQPDAQQLIEQWREQGKSLRSLPKFQLKHDLSDRILEKIQEKSEPVESASAVPALSRVVGAVISRDSQSSVSESSATPRPESSKFLWGLGVGVLSSLATMLLIIQTSGYRLQGSEGQETGPLQIAMADPAGQGGAVLPSDVSVAVSPQASPLSSEPDTDSVATMLAARGNHEIRNADRIMAPISEQATRLSERPLLAHDLGEAPDFAIAADSIAADSIAADSIAADSIAADIGPESETPVEPAVPTPVNIEQIFFVNFRANDQPLAVVSEVFSRNQIEILNGGLSPDPTGHPLAGRKAAHPAQENETEGFIESAEPSNLRTMSRLYEQSPDGMEALFVVATRSQLNQAMNELADRADISGYQVTARFISDMVAQQWKSLASKDLQPPTMDEMIAQMKAQRLAKFKTMAPVPRAMAQQIRPFGSSRNSLPNPELAARDRTPGASTATQPYAGISRSQSFAPAPGRPFNPALPMRSLSGGGAAPEAESSSTPAADKNRDEPGQATDRSTNHAAESEPENTSEEELVHFLLFVRAANSGP